MTAQNLPHEPEFEQAYKGMSSPPPLATLIGFTLSTL